MIVVESLQDFEVFVKKIEGKQPVIIPVMTDKSAHPKLNSVCALFVFSGDDNFILPFNHSEAINLPLDVLTRVQFKVCFTPSKNTLKHLLNCGGVVIDLKGLEYYATGEIIEEFKFYPPVMQTYHQRWYDRDNINQLVPIGALFKFAKAYKVHLEQFIDKARITSKEFKFHNNVLLPACEFMESGGVHVSLDKFTKSYGERSNKFVRDGLVFTEYNPYTTTGRVTNKHGGVNYAAIEKKNGTREAFTSRFNSGAMVLIDFESFHLRLIADLIGFNLPNEPVHQYLAKEYFQTSEITPEQYEEGKKLTFRYLYSDRQEGAEFAFFRQVYYFIEQTWETVKNTGIFTFESGRNIYLSRLDPPSPAKLFNYILQWRETEIAMTAIHQLINVFEGKQSKVTLYTYDSVLIDYSYEDGRELLIDTVETLSQCGKYPVRVYAGPNYQDLVNISKIVT
jgi:hypothetical protein